MYRIHADHPNNKFMVFKDGDYVKSFDTLDEARAYIRAQEILGAGR